MLVTKMNRAYLRIVYVFLYHLVHLVQNLFIDHFKERTARKMWNRIQGYHRHEEALEMDLATSPAKKPPLPTLARESLSSDDYDGNKNVTEQ